MSRLKKYFLGVDVGSSSVKTCLFDAELGSTVAFASVPDSEQPIISRQPGWAEQDPKMWWENFEAGCHAVFELSRVDAKEVGAIGIAYQMHGLVVTDADHVPLRDAIIWCDSRATDIGLNSFHDIGANICLNTVLNSPGNFTASRLRWVRENEPDLYRKIRHMLLPGDFLALCLTGEASTTEGGLSEAILWNFRDRCPSKEVLSHFDIDPSLVPRTVPAIGFQGSVLDDIADRLGLSPSTPLTYRCGDQSNNAFSLGANAPGEVVATAGTSGVIYAVTDNNVSDTLSRVNTFIHVNNSLSEPRNGVLVCLNGTAILYRWLKTILGGNDDSFGYEDLNKLALQSPPGANGLHVFPFGNGAERILNDLRVDAHITHLDFNRQGRADLVRASLEGIVYALRLGFDVLKELGIQPQVIKATSTNLFLGPAFCSIFTNAMRTPVHIYQTTGAEGAARGAALGSGYFSNPEETFRNLTIKQVHEPDSKLSDRYASGFAAWKKELKERILPGKRIISRQ